MKKIPFILLICLLTLVLYVGAQIRIEKPELKLVNNDNTYIVNQAKDISVNYWKEGDTGFITTGQGDKCNFTMANAEIVFRHYPDGVEFDLKGKGVIPKFYYACNNKKAISYFSFKTVEKEYSEPIYDNKDSEIIEPNIIGYDVKPQAFDYSDNKEKGEVLFSLKSEYALSLTDEWNIDPTFQITNITDDTVKENVRCEGGGAYCHIAINDTSLTAYYPFDVNTSTLRNWIGDNPNGRDVTLIGGAHQSENMGKYGGGFNLTNRNDWGQIGSGSDFETFCANPSGCSIVLWAKHFDIPPFPGNRRSYLISRSTDGGNDQFFRFRLEANNGDVTTIIWDDGGTNLCVIRRNDAITDTDWHHFAFIFDNVSNLLYSCSDADCSSVACDINIKTGVGGWGDSEPTLIGTHSSGDPFWRQNNTIDELMFFNRSISIAELGLIYNATFPRFYPPDNNHTINVTINSANAVNVTLNLSNQNNTNISLRIQHAGGFTDFVNMTNGVTQNFSIDVSSIDINLSMKYYPDGFGMWSPILLNNITLVTYNISVITDSCSCPSSGNWIVDCFDNCTINTVCELSGNNLDINGNGTFTIEANIDNVKNMTVDFNCDVRGLANITGMFN